MSKELQNFLLFKILEEVSIELCWTGWCVAVTFTGQPWWSRASHYNRSCSDLSSCPHLSQSGDGVSGTLLTFNHPQETFNNNNNIRMWGSFFCQFYEGYGQTECTAGCTMTLAGDWTAGNILPYSLLVSLSL